MNLVFDIGLIVGLLLYVFDLVVAVVFAVGQLIVGLGFGWFVLFCC